MTSKTYCDMRKQTKLDRVQDTTCRIFDNKSTIITAYMKEKVKFSFKRHLLPYVFLTTKLPQKELV